MWSHEEKSRLSENVELLMLLVYSKVISLKTNTKTLFIADEVSFSIFRLADMVLVFPGVAGKVFYGVIKGIAGLYCRR